MKIHDGPDALRGMKLRHPVMTIGTFDGVHVGHRHVLRETIRLAAERAGESLVVTFKHHPRAIIAQEAPKLITSLPHKLALFRELGLDHALVLVFDDVLQNTPATEFAHSIFEDAVGAELVLLGHNCRFGMGREGDYAFLESRGDEFSFETRLCSEVRLGEHNVSSTDIRAAILDGRLGHAASLLGRPYSIWGTVVEGNRRGRTIGFPTANLDIHHELRPPRGVYGCRVSVDGVEYDALTNIGLRPTFESSDDWEVRDRFETIEVHLLEFAGDLYGRDLEVVFLTRIRDEFKFRGVDDLVAQIEVDRGRFKGWLDRGSDH